MCWHQFIFQVWVVIAALSATTSARAEADVRLALVDPSTAIRLSNQVGPGVDVRQVQFVRIPEGLAAATQIVVPLDGVERLLELVPYSVRAPGFDLRVDAGPGGMRSVPAKPSSTVRGKVVGAPGSHVAGGFVDDRLALAIRMGQSTWGVEALSRDPRYGMIYRQEHLAASELLLCGVVHGEMATCCGSLPPVSQSAIGHLCVADMAIDATYETFLRYGSVDATLERIELLTNVVNLMFELQIGVTHRIADVVVRTTDADPYTPPTASEFFEAILEWTALLCDLVAEWRDVQPPGDRDLVYLFAEAPGSFFGGYAGDGGGGLERGICFAEASECVPAVTLGVSAAASVPERGGAFLGDVSLVAHELGHLWNVAHSDVTSECIMAPSAPPQDGFCPQTVSIITAFRETRDCLDCSGVPANDQCVNAMEIEPSGGLTVVTSNATPLPGVVDLDLPLGSPSCHAGQDPASTHSTVWYRFEAVHPSIRVETCETSQVGDTVIALFEGTCGSLVEVACNDDDGCGATGGLAAFCVDELQVGQAYYLMVGHPGGLDSIAGSVEVEFLSPADCPVQACVGDVDRDGLVGFADLVQLLAEWGPCNSCPSDLDGDGDVGFSDLVSLLAVWGPC